VKQILDWAQGQQAAYTLILRQLVECESPSDDAAAVNRFVELLSDLVTPHAKVKTVPGGKFGKHLLCEFPAAKRNAGQVLVLSHSDTVWPMGTLRTMPFREAEGRLWGPGTLDMKGGIAIVLFAMRALREMEIPLPHKVLLQVNSDEEVGSGSSRPLTEKNARASKAVYVVEPGTGLAGKLKTARKGVGAYTVSVKGRAAHAGVDFGNGASAIVELARQIEKIAGFTNLDRGITVNPGVIGGGTRSNVIAAEANAYVDIRIPKARDFAALDRKFQALKPFDRRCSLTITGGLNRPPMERSAGTIALYRTAQKVARAMGLEIEESATGGGSDGNFTAALGVPTLDGLGPVGEGAHAPNESILTDRIADRIALFAGLMSYREGQAKIV
jgi:glutamate carboxypeptidase